MLTLRGLFSMRREGRAEPSETAAPAVPVVENMLSDMISKGTKVATFSARDDDDARACSAKPLSYRHIHNRLKIMCGLNPFFYPEPVSGRFQFAAYGSMYEAECCFKDSNNAHAERCTIRVERMSGASHAPAA